MAKKRKGCQIWFTMCNLDSCVVSDGGIIMRPEIRVVGPFDRCFGELFVAYASDKICSFVMNDLKQYLPKPDPAPSEEVPE